MVTFPRRGDVYWARFDPVVGSEQGGTRPAVIVQNDVGNRFSDTTIIAAVTSNPRVAGYPFGVRVPRGVLTDPSIVNCAQVRTVDKSRLSATPIGRLDDETMRAIDEALRVSLGMY